MVQDSSSPVLSIMDSEQGRQTPTTQSSNEPATVNQVLVQSSLSDKANDSAKFSWMV